MDSYLKCGKKRSKTAILFVYSIFFPKKRIYISYTLLHSNLIKQTLKQQKMKKFNEFKALVASLEGDADKFYNKGNSAAGTRVRKGMQDLKNLAQAIRLEVQATKNKA